MYRPAIPNTLLMQIRRKTGFFSKDMSIIVPRASLNDSGSSRQGHSGAAEMPNEIKNMSRSEGRTVIENILYIINVRKRNKEIYVEGVFRCRHPWRRLRGQIWAER